MNDAQTDAAYTFVDGVRSKADHHRWGAPLWHEWALRDAFAAGCHWQAQQSAPLTPAQIAASPEVRALVEALEFYSCKDGCNDCTENERDLIGCGWTALAALAAFKAMEAGE